MKNKYLFLIPVLLFTSCQKKLPSAYTVTFDANGGTFESGTIKEITVKRKECVEMDEYPTHEDDYLFGHWYPTQECIGEAFDFATPITKNLTLYARWLNNSGNDSDWDGLADSIDPAPSDNNYVANLLEIYPPIQRVKMAITVDYTRFLGDENQFNSDLEKLGNVCATDIYQESTTALEGASTLYEPLVGSDNEELYMQLGCRNIEKHTCDTSEYTVDTKDTYTVMLAHHYFVKDNNNYEVLFITNQGTDSEAEWYSDFDVGIYNDDYAHVTKVYNDAHVDWLNNGQDNTPIHHKGFDVATNRQFKDVIVPYINSNLDKQANLIIFNTGHSRGAAIANLLAKKFLDQKNELNIYKCFTYTYATPTTVYDSTNKANIPCNGVFNILNGNDLVAEVPLKAWDFYRYGEDKIYSISEHVEAWQEFIGTTSEYKAADINKITGMMLEMAEDREKIYAPHTNDNNTKFFEGSYDTETERNAIKNDFIKKAKIWNGESTIDFTESEEDGKFVLRGYDRPVALMSRLSILMGSVNELNLEKLLAMLADGILCDKYQEIENELIGTKTFFDGGTKLLNGHRGTSYYFISSELINN